MTENIAKSIIKAKERILGCRSSSGRKPNEAETRQGIINPFFQSLGWDFGNFDLVRCEYSSEGHRDPIDYAFFSAPDAEKPVLLLEAKALETDLSNSRIVEQLCRYMGQTGVQWGVLSNGDKYVMYNSRRGTSYEDQKFLTLTISDVDTENGKSLSDLSGLFNMLLSRENLENERIQQAYQNHMQGIQIESALKSLLSPPYENISIAIQREFRCDDVNTSDDVNVKRADIRKYLNDLAGDDDLITAIQSTFESDASSEVLVKEISDSSLTDDSNAAEKSGPVSSTTKRVTINNLLEEKLIKSTDRWRFNHKGDIFWGEITSDGCIQVGESKYTSPSNACQALVGSNYAGWSFWQYRDKDGEWRSIDILRIEYRERHNLGAITRKRGSRKKTAK